VCDPVREYILGVALTAGQPQGQENLFLFMDCCVMCDVFVFI